MIALGSNLGDRGEHLTKASEEIGQAQGVKLLSLSPIVESNALTAAGFDESKPKYLNAVAIIETSLKPKELMRVLQDIESRHGRVRLERWGSRTLDLDIITFGDEVKASRELTIPHPRAYQRSFVLVPWAALDPDAVLPGHGLVKELVEDLPDRDEVWFL